MSAVRINASGHGLPMTVRKKIVKLAPRDGTEINNKTLKIPAFWIPISWDTPTSIPVKWWLLPDVVGRSAGSSRTFM
jgi:hypothetical protein